MISMGSHGLGAHAPPVDARPLSAFAKSVLAVLEGLEYRLCESGEDLEAIYRLRYESYLRAGMVRPQQSRTVHDRFDELPNAYRFGIYYDGELVSTIRLHYVSAKFPLSPSTEVFGDVLAERLGRGETFIDPSRFAADQGWSSTLRVLPYVTLRLAVVACKFFSPTYCLTAIKEEHAAFYSRIFRSELAVPPRSYPGLTVPVHLLQSRCSEHLDQTIERFPFFASTSSEQRMLFERREAGSAPLTVLPTAKYAQAA